MGRSGSAKRLRDTASLPQELMHIIFGKLELKDKLNAALVCKQWDQLLMAGTAEARHWHVDYNLDTVWAKATLREASKGPPAERIEVTLERWFAHRAAAIKSVHVTATLSPDQKGWQKRKLVREHLPLLIGCLSTYDNLLHLKFIGQCPRLLFSPAAPTLLCPMVVALSLTDLVEPISTGQFAVICKLSRLEELTISTSEMQVGLQELTADVSKLVNLRVLKLDASHELKYIPESISCLQNLEFLRVDCSSITALPVGLGTLANLTSLHISLYDDDFGPPLTALDVLPNLKGLTAVELVSCNLKIIPEELIDLPALKSVDVSGNHFSAPEGWTWWPTTLSRLTQLETLVMSVCGIMSLPPHISVLRQLKKLDLSDNKLASLPDELCSLADLRELVLWGNRLPEPPVSVLSRLTALTAINLGNNYCRIAVGPPRRIVLSSIRSSLLPILHPGLVYLNLQPLHRQTSPQLDPGSQWTRPRCGIWDVQWLRWPTGGRFRPCFSDISQGSV